MPQSQQNPRTRLRELIREAFNLSELKTLCHDLAIPWEDLVGQSLTDKIRELIQYCERNRKVETLVDYCKCKRPRAFHWPTPKKYKEFLTKDQRKRKDSNLAKQRRQDRLDEDIPYLLDRKEQKNHLKRAIRIYLAHRSSKPFLCVIYGEQQQGHRSFRKRLRDKILPEMFHLAPNSIQEYQANLETNLSSLNDSKIREILLGSLPNGAKLPSTIPANSPKVLQLKLGELLEHKSIMIHSTIHGNQWEPDGFKAIQTYMKFWSEWPKLNSVQNKLFIFLHIRYERGRKWQWIGRPIDKQICRQVESLHFNIPETPDITILPKLGNVNKNDGYAWLGHHDVEVFLERNGLSLKDIQDIQDKIDLIFEGRQREFCLNEAAKKIQNILYEQLAS